MDTALINDSVMQLPRVFLLAMFLSIYVTSTRKYQYLHLEKLDRADFTINEKLSLVIRFIKRSVNSNMLFINDIKS